MLRLRWWFVLTLAALPACEARSGTETRPTLVWAAAADLAAAAPDLAGAFEQETGIRVDVTLAASGQLAQQVLNGAPIDVFASADSGWVARVAEAGKVVPGSEAVYARGHLVMFTMIDTLVIGAVEDLTRPAVRRITLANPETAPYGRAARQALQSAGLWDQLQARIVLGDNVRHTVQLAESRNVEVAITSRALMREGTGRWVMVPESLHAPIVQVAAVISGRPHQAEAERFLRFLLGAEGRRILASYSFALPQADSLP